MGRQKSEAPGPNINTQLPPSVVDRIETEDAAARQHSELILSQFGDGQSYERTRLVTETKFFMSQSAEAMLEAGKRLILIKEHEPHGEFVAIVEKSLGIHVRAAQRMMSASLKYLSPKLQSKTTSLSLLGKTKLFDLVSEDDDDLAALAEGGTIAGLSLDDIDRMSSRELRAALRDSKEQGNAKDQILADKNSRIDELSSNLALAKRRIKALSVDEAEKELRREAALVAYEAEVTVTGNLRQVCVTMLDNAEQSGGADCRPFLAGMVRHIEVQLAAIRDEFCLPDAEGAEEFSFLTEADA